jgi:hypothetical protein
MGFDGLDRLLNVKHSDEWIVIGRPADARRILEPRQRRRPGVTVCAMACALTSMYALPVAIAMARVVQSPAAPLNPAAARPPSS